MRILPVNNYNYQSKTQNNKQQNVNFSQNTVSLGVALEKASALRELPIKLADGSDYAELICRAILRTAPQYDSRADRGLQALFTLGEEHISGHDISRLYDDVCGGNIEKMVKVLRAREAGIIESRPFHNTISETEGEKIDVNAVVAKVDILTEKGKLGAGAFYPSHEAVNAALK